MRFKRYGKEFYFGHKADAISRVEPRLIAWFFFAQINSFRCQDFLIFFEDNFQVIECSWYFIFIFVFFGNFVLCWHMALWRWGT